MSLSQAERHEVGFGQSIGISRSIGVTLKPKCVPFAGLNFDRWKVEFPRAAVPIRWPFFWHDAPWHRVDVENASRAASQATDAGIFVAGLSCEVGTSVLHQQGICPYRPDRYGLCVDDIAHRSVIDLRLVPP